MRCSIGPDGDSQVEECFIGVEGHGEFVFDAGMCADFFRIEQSACEVCRLAFRGFDGDLASEVDSG